MMRFINSTAGAVLSIMMLLTIALTGTLFFLISLLLWLLTVPFDSRRVVLHRFSCYCLGFWAFIMPTWRIRVEGREKIPDDRPCVIVANHQSQLDILVTALLYRHFKWVSKAEVYRIPLIGWQMALNRYISIRRGYVDSISRMMESCEKALDNGSSILIFPEGTRSDDGQVKPFKSGAFILAEKKEVPVVPIVIYGTREALPSNRLVSLGTHRLCVKVLDAIPFEEYSGQAPDVLAETVRQRIATHLKLIEKRIELGLS